MSFKRLLLPCRICKVMHPWYLNLIHLLVLQQLQTAHRSLVSSCNERTHTEATPPQNLGDPNSVHKYAISTEIARWWLLIKFHTSLPPSQEMVNRAYDFLYDISPVAFTVDLQRRPSFNYLIRFMRCFFRFCRGSKRSGTYLCISLCLWSFQFSSSSQKRHSAISCDSWVNATAKEHL